MSKGRYFIHEHPDRASSWKLPQVETLRNAEGTWEVKTDICMHGLTTVKQGVRAPARKPTRFLTNSWCVAMALDKRCDGRHAHIELMEGRAAGAAVYPRQLCETISRAVHKQKGYYRTGMAFLGRGGEGHQRVHQLGLQQGTNLKSPGSTWE